MSLDRPIETLLSQINKLSHDCARLVLIGLRSFDRPFVHISASSLVSLSFKSEPSAYSGRSGLMDGWLAVNRGAMFQIGGTRW